MTDEQKLKIEMMIESNDLFIKYAGLDNPSLIQIEKMNLNLKNLIGQK